MVKKMYSFILFSEIFTLKKDENYIKLMHQTILGKKVHKFN